MVTVIEAIPNERRGVAIGRSAVNGDINRMSVYRFNASHKEIVGHVTPDGIIIADDNTMALIALNYDSVLSIMEKEFGINQ